VKHLHKVISKNSPCLGLGLSACQSAGTIQGQSSDIASAVPQNYKQIIVEKIKNTLKDPYSVRSAEISAPAPGFVGLIRGGSQPVVCARFNAKNGFGAYGGIEEWAFIFQNGQIIDMMPENPMPCQNHVYSPFPELEKLN
jgi:hypothetical protein